MPLLSGFRDSRFAQRERFDRERFSEDKAVRGMRDECSIVIAGAADEVGTAVPPKVVDKCH